MAAGPTDPDPQQLIQLLNSLELLPPAGATPPTRTFDTGAAQVQVLKAGVTKITSWVSRLIAVAGGAGAVWAAVEAYFNHSRPGLQIALVASAAAIIGLAALSMALVIGADLHARAAGTAALYHARGQVAAAYEYRYGPAGAAAPARALARLPASAAATAPADALSSDLSVGLLALATSGHQVQARVKDTAALLYVTGVRYKSGTLKLRLTASAAEQGDAGSWYDLADIDEFDTTS
jgi:hypothetical protein